MLKLLFFILAVVLCFIVSSKNAYAIVDPLSASNNKFGVHILFTSELEKARELVNTNGGDWGYVTIPIQASDKDLEKWQKFMDDCERMHLIPIIRIATENHYFDTSVWRKPDGTDVLDFANFLNSLEWPVKNKYIIIFNEVNRDDEWEGNPNPGEYALILNYATEIFKSLSHDFFIISAGLDNASANDQYNYMIQMNQEVSGIFGKIDGLGSHSYPNPAFSVAPWIITRKSISSFKFEQNLAFELSGKNLPVFITETGWSTEKVSQNQIASYFAYAFENVWSNENVVTVTPFLLQAGPGPFFQFSLIREDGAFNEISKTLQGIPKTKGTPPVNINPTSNLSQSQKNAPIKTFSLKMQYQNSSAQKSLAITPFLKWLLKISE